MLTMFHPIVVASLAWAAPVVGQIPLRAVSHCARADEVAQVVRFQIVYNREPDFLSVDPEGRQADSFQFFLDTMPGNQGMCGTSPYAWETVIRGEEINFDGEVPVRDHVRGPSGDPRSGGWGPATGAVPYTLDGNRQQFEVPFWMLNTSSGKFRYSLELCRYGMLTDRSVGAAVAVDRHHDATGARAVALGARIRNSLAALTALAVTACLVGWLALRWRRAWLGLEPFPGSPAARAAAERLILARPRTGPAAPRGAARVCADAVMNHS